MKTKWILLSVSLLFTAAEAAQAQFGYAANPDGSTATITNYTGTASSVTFPATIGGFTVTSIGNGAIGVLDSGDVTQITIPGTVTSIGEFAFASSGLTSATLGSGLTNIGPYAFEDCNGLTGVTLPDSLIAIDAGGFRGCVGLQSVAIPATLSSIGSYAFSACGKLAAVTIADGVASIGDYAFQGDSLGAVTLPATVTNIGQAPFNSCPLLKTISVDSANTFYSSSNGVLFDASQTTLIEYPQGQGADYTIPLTVTSIGPAAFANTGLTNANIAGGVTNIGGGPFSGCSLLTAINVDSSNMFYSSMDGVLFDKTQTTLIEYPQAKVGNYSIPMGVTTIESNAFTDCENLTGITLPESLASIGSFAFSSSGLTSVAIGDSLTNIGQGAFEGCANLAGVTIANGVSTIGSQAFLGCSSLPRIAIPNSVTNFGSGMFDVCSALTNVFVGANVTNLGGGEFGFCPKLAAIYFAGNAPITTSSSAFRGDTATVYYLPGTTGWSGYAAISGLSTILWNATIQANGASFGVSNNQFGFDITGTPNISVVVEACADLSAPDWTPLQTLALTNGSFHFSEPYQAATLARYYRLTAP
jgi:hypothetical protein